MRIANKIGLSFLVVAIILTSIIVSIFYAVAKDALERSIDNNLSTVVQSRAYHIKTYLEMLEISVAQLSKSTELESFLKISGGEDPRREESFAVAMKRLRRTIAVNPAVAEFLLMNETGAVVVSSDENSIGTDESSDALFLGAQKRTYIKDVYFSRAKNIPLIAVSTLLLDSSTQESLGVIAVRVKLDDLNHIITKETGLGAKGEIYIVNQYGYMITPSKYKQGAVLKQKVDTQGIMMARLHKTREHVLLMDKMMQLYSDYRGVRVLGAHEHFPRMGWVILGEIEAREAFRPLDKILQVALAILFIVPLAAWLLGFFIARLITKPLDKLYQGAAIIGSGNLDYKVGTLANDEVGQLSRAFDAMTEGLKKTMTSFDRLNTEITERKKLEENLTQSLGEARKSRKIMVSMLTDNNQVREKLEKHLSDLKNTQDQLLQSQKMESVGRLAGGMAHDFNNQLMVIGGYSEFLLSGLASNDHRYSELMEIKKASERSANLVKQLLAFSRSQKMIPKVFDINVLIADLNKMFNRLIREDIEFVTILAENVGMIKFDPTHLEQVLVNLVVNARDAMPHGGKIVVETSPICFDENHPPAYGTILSGEDVVLAVSDNGEGMSAEVKTKIFEPFFTTKEPGKGTGLGLATVYGIVTQNGGSINVYSELGHGSVFKIYIPCAHEPADLLIVQKTKEVPRGTETVLVVEDDEAVRKVAVTVLTKQGYQVIETAEGKDALRLAQESAPGVIRLLLTDVVMPKMNGKELAGKIKKMLPDIKVLYMSGYSDEIIKGHEFSEKKIQLLQKPFTPAALAFKVREMLDEAANDVCT